MPCSQSCQGWLFHAIAVLLSVRLFDPYLYVYFPGVRCLQGFVPCLRSSFMGCVSPLSRQDTEAPDTFEKLIENAFTFPLRYPRRLLLSFQTGCSDWAADSEERMEICLQLLCPLSASRAAGLKAQAHLRKVKGDLHPLCDSSPTAYPVCSLESS